MAEFIAVSLPSQLLTASTGQTTYWVVDTVVGTSTYGTVVCRCTSLALAEDIAARFNAVAP